MEPLKLGNQGPKVKRLQQELKIHGFNLAPDRRGELTP